MRLRKFRDLQLRDQVLLSYLALLILPVALTGIFVFSWSARVVQRQTTTILSQTLEQAELHITYALQEIGSLAEVVYKNSEVQRILGDEQRTDYEQYQDFLILDEIIRRIEDTPRVYRARIFVDDEKLFAREGGSVLPLSAARGDVRPTAFWRHGVVASRDGMGERRTLTYVLPIRAFLDVNRTLGYLHISVLEDEFEEILSRMRVDASDGHALMLTDAGFVADSVGRESEAADVASDVRRRLEATKFPDWVTSSRNGDSYRLLVRRIDGAQWTLVSLVPSRALARHRIAAGWVTVGAIAFCSVLAAVAASLVSTRITAGIHDLISRMHSVSEIQWDHAHSSETDYSRDEIGRLRESFQLMVSRLRELIDENYVVKIQKREAELHALQAQINPHFLYNVLESINWMARAAGAGRISDMVTRLGRFYRLGLSGGKDTVTIREELEYVRTYVEIQQIRFGDSVRVTYSVAEDIMEHPIAKLSLQPLVENALVHGILTKDDQCGRIEVRGFRDTDGAVVMQVLDDGHEVDFDKVAYILSDHAKTSTQGFGIRNIRERLRLFFGEGSDLVIRKHDGWTAAEIRLP
jgi:two-component system sensor histidine kinase YesM